MHFSLAIISSTLVLCIGGQAFAQTPDALVNPLVSPPPTYGAATRALPSGSPKLVLKAFAPYVTQTGVGCSGADVSEPASGFVTLGWSADLASGNRVADDFDVPTNMTWTLTEVEWLAYQVGSPTTGTLTGINLNVWNSDPAGIAPPSSFLNGPANSLLSEVWTGVYRVATNDLSNCSRPIIEVTSDGSWMPPLVAGKYWIDSTLSGTLANVWCPVQVPQSATPNGLQSVALGVFQTVSDGGCCGQVTDAGGQDFLFQLEGSSAGVPTFCTSYPASLAVCTSSASGSGPSLSKSGGAGSYTFTVGPVPGGPNTGVFIWSRNGTSMPVFKNPSFSAPVGGFGWRCITPNRGIAATPGGTVGSCNGSYAWDLGGYVNASGVISSGDTLHIQGWHRDPGYPSGALFTQGVGPIPVVP